MYTTAWCAPAIGFTSEAALIFYRASMLLAAASGDAGCGVLAVATWLLRRCEQAGGVLFASWTGSGTPGSRAGSSRSL